MKHLKWTLIFGIFWSLTHCASTPSEEPEDLGNEQLENQNDYADDQELNDDANYEDLNQNMNDSQFDNQDWNQEQAGDANLDNTEATTQTAAGSQGQVLTNEDAASRVVRYVISDGVPAFKTPDATSEQVATYQKGNVLVVTDLGEWMRIAEGYFIKATDLSDKVVGYTVRENRWRQ